MLKDRHLQHALPLFTAAVLAVPTWAQNAKPTTDEDVKIARLEALSDAQQDRIEALQERLVSARAQDEDAARVDKKTDIYSFGATLFAFLAGRPPFQGSSAWAVVSQHMSAAVPDLQEINPKVPEALFEIIKKCMAKSPEERPDDMAEVIDSLLAVQAAVLTQKSDEPERKKQPAATIDVPKEVLKSSSEDTSATITDVNKSDQHQPIMVGERKKGGLPIALVGGLVAVAAVVVIVVVLVLPMLSGSNGKTGNGSKTGGGSDSGTDTPSGTGTGTSSGSRCLRSSCSSV